MSRSQTDTEITLGTGRMLGIFFAFVLVCAFFFAIGFSLGRKTYPAGVAASLTSSTPPPASIVRPSPAKSGSVASPAGDFSFYKAVGAKNADAALTPADPKATPAGAAPSAASVHAEAEAPVRDAPETVPATPAAGYFVQVAAVSRQEDAESLVEALKKKQYPAFAANTPADKFFHIQVGPYADMKEAEAMRVRLISDGYNPIVKK
jgi:cell division septation protein DedD